MNACVLLASIEDENVIYTVGQVDSSDLKDKKKQKKNRERKKGRKKEEERNEFRVGNEKQEKD